MHLPYQPARSCTGSATAGAWALMRWAMRRFGCRNAGIYNCRPPRGGKGHSLHAEGRASDLSLWVTSPAEKAAGDRLAAFLVANAHALGIQCVIWNRKIWSSSRALEGWRNYGGVNPHTDHLHVELTWEGARQLTEALLDRVAGGAPAPPPSTPLPKEDDDMPAKQFAPGEDRLDVALTPGKWAIYVATDTGDVPLRVAIGSARIPWVIFPWRIAHAMPARHEIPDGRDRLVSIWKPPMWRPVEGGEEFVTPACGVRVTPE